MFSIMKEFKFEAAHRILGHEGKCRFLHGHSYRAVVTVSQDYLDKLGMVMDFSDVKAAIGTWVKQNWDHCFIGHQNDPLIHAQEERCYSLGLANPTAENLAYHLWYELAPIINGPNNANRKITRVEIWEQEDSCGVYVPDYKTAVTKGMT